MKICKLCNKEFKFLIEVDGAVRNLGSRKYCLDCSPFGSGNKKSLGKIITFKCRDCGETHGDQFYGHKRGKCGKCHNKEMHEKGKEKRLFALNILGAKCKSCGFDKFPCSLDIHHLDPNKKDEKFNQMRSWSNERIKQEITNCILLCRNCHTAYHNGYEINF